MAAVRSPLLPSPNSGLMSAFSPYSESPTSPAAHYNKRSSSCDPPSFLPSSQASNAAYRDSTGHLLPQPQKSPGVGSPSDIADPSPIASSNGTDTTDFDDTAGEDQSELTPQNEDGPARPTSIKIQTKDADGNDFTPAASEDDHPSSVIHAPKGFESFHTNKSPAWGRSTPTPSQRSDITVVTPQDETGRKNVPPQSPPPLSTEIPPSTERFQTPQAQTWPEGEAWEHEKGLKIRSKSLEDIPETQDAEGEEGHDSHFDTVMEQMQSSADEVASLRMALGECWTLCNTLAGLSHIHRERAFRQKGKNDGREQAWKSCWTLCQRLYETWDEEQPSQVGPTLNLCREFCQSLFEVRQRGDDVADSVLRVSFELNNHLYNTHDRALPEAFRERTLDFYITLCHRLMKQRSMMGGETDDLLRACWSLAEMLFSLRQNKREGKPADEEFLGSAVQACWELCDLFREGWTQVRPDRGTPRPSQATFTQAFQQARQSEPALTITLEEDMEEYEDNVGRQNPETPTTIFEDTQQMSPDDASVPNIVVLGPEAKDRYIDHQWPSSASSRSGYSSVSSTADDSATTSTSTINAGRRGRSGAFPREPEDPRLACLKLLIVRAAVNLGYSPTLNRSVSGSGTPTNAGKAGGGTKNDQPLATFIKSVPSNSFGSAPWQSDLLESYKRLVASDPAFRSAGPPRRASAAHIARSVQWMVERSGPGGGQYAWLADLFRWVFGFRIEEAASRAGVMIRS